jgi:hypothetical protein
MLHFESAARDGRFFSSPAIRDDRKSHFESAVRDGRFFF